MFLNLTAFSQKSTEKTLAKSEDSSIAISKVVAKQILRDLYRKDSLQAELYIVTENYKLLQSSIALKDTIINNKNAVIEIYKQKEKNYEEIISLKDKQIQQCVEYTDKLKEDLKKSKKRTTIGASATVVSFLLAVGISLVR